MASKSAHSKARDGPVGPVIRIAQAAQRAGVAWRYGVVPGATILLAFGAERALGHGPIIAPYVAFYVAVALSAWLGGRGPGLLTVMASAVVADRFFLPGPLHSRPVLIATLMFLAAASLVALLCAAFRDAMSRSHEAAATVRRQAELLRLSDDAMITWQPDGTIEDWNRGAEGLYGYSAAQARGQNIRRLLETVFPISLEDTLARLHAEGRWEGDLRHSTRTGEVRIVSSGMQLVHETVGDRVQERVFETNRDVTERMAWQEALAASERRFRDLADNIAQLAWMADHDGKFVWCNQRWKDYTGAWDASAPNAIWRYAPPGEQKRIEDSVRHAVETGEIWEDTLMLRFRDGGYRWFLARAMPIRDGDGAVTGWFGTATDITEMRAIEETLSLALDAADMGLWDWKLSTGELEWSARTKELFGLAPDAVMTYPRFLEAVHPDDRAIIEARTREALATKADYEHEMRVPQPDGTVRWLLANGRGQYDESGMPVRMVGVARDTTDRKRAELQLEEANAHLATANARLLDADARKNEFLGVLSHELRNPLAPIRNSLYVLERAAPGGEQAGRALRVIERQVRHIARLVDDLLDLTRISRGKITLRRERVDLCALAQQAAEDQRDAYRQGGVDLSVHVPEEPLWVDGDAARLNQIIGNLLHNAAKFTPQGGKASLGIARGERGEAIIRVRDSGMGMSPETLGRVFEPFVQATQTIERSRGGLGLGLALVKTLVELHGGSVTAASEGEGRGAEFVVRLPSLVSTEVSPPRPTAAATV